MSFLDRRQFIRLNAAALAGAALTPAVAAYRQPRPWRSAASAARNASPGFYRFAAGDVEVSVLSDGHFKFPMEMLEDEVEPLEFLAPNAQPAESAEFFRSVRVRTDSVPLQVSPVLLDIGGRRVLGGTEILLTGDAITNTHAAFERPEWQQFVDIDREQGARTRRQLLDRAAADEMLILGYHLPFPGLGHALPYGDAYRWHPAGTTALS
jgi:hypothetical protein